MILCFPFFFPIHTRAQLFNIFPPLVFSTSYTRILQLIADLVLEPTKLEWFEKEYHSYAITARMYLLSSIFSFTISFIKSDRIESIHR